MHEELFFSFSLELQCSYFQSETYLRNTYIISMNGSGEGVKLEVKGMRVNK